ncbi:MAG: alpha/beta fold hydrolase [Saprospiraceae bacterium]
MIELNYKIIGEGNPIVILHGLFGMLDNLQLLGKKLAEKGNMVYLVDQRDHGRSSHTESFSYPLLSNDLLEFLESQWLHQTVLIGHSMGGKTALQFVIDNPGIVTKLIIVDIGIKKYPGGHEAIFDALMSIPLQNFNSRDEVFQQLLEKIPDAGTVHFLMKNLSRNKLNNLFEWKMNLPNLQKNYQNILSEIKVVEKVDTDVLFIRGQLSSYITDEDIPVLLKNFPNAKFATIPNAGHWVHADNLKDLEKEILSFLET